MKQVAIIYHYLALYRLPIFQELMLEKTIDYTIFSGTESEISISKIDEEYASMPVENGGLRWSFFRNKWLIKKKFLWQSGLISLILKNKFDAYIFLGSPYHLTTWFAAILARIMNKKVYFWMHGVYKDKLNVVDYIKLFVFYQLANEVFLYGNRAAQKLIEHKVISPNKIHVIYNSLDYKRCLEIRRQLKIEDFINFRRKYFADDRLPVISFIGRLNNVKRIDMLIDAQKILREKHGRDFFNVIIIGDGNEKSNLESMIATYSLQSNVHFAGAVYDEVVNGDILMHADLCVTPGEVGLTAIHAMSYGTPTISHDNLNIQMPEVEAIVPGVTGDLYKRNDINDLSVKIEHWFQNHPYKDDILISQCFKVIEERYNPQVQSKIFKSVFDKI